MLDIGRCATKEEIQTIKKIGPTKAFSKIVTVKGVPKEEFWMGFLPTITDEEIYLAVEKKGGKREDIIIH
jgi:hypothetical protein